MSDPTTLDAFLLVKVFEILSSETRTDHALRRIEAAAHEDTRLGEVLSFYADFGFRFRECAITAPEIPGLDEVQDNTLREIITAMAKSEEDR